MHPVPRSPTLSDPATQPDDWLSAGEVESAHDIVPGAAAEVRDGTREFAAYRDAEGALHRLTAVCTDLGCVVSSNAAAPSGEKSALEATRGAQAPQGLAPLPAEAAWLDERPGRSRTLHPLAREKSHERP